MKARYNKYKDTDVEKAAEYLLSEPEDTSRYASVQYYTDKNISVSYLRAKKKKDADRVVALYGDAEDRYW